MRNALIEKATGRCVSVGYVSFEDADLAKHTVVPVRTGAPLPANVPLQHLTVQDGEFVELDAQTKAVVDADLIDEERRKAVGALHIERVVPDASYLPIPPPRPKLLVGLVDGGGPNGHPALAISTASGWAVFDADRLVV